MSPSKTSDFVGETFEPTSPGLFPTKPAGSTESIRQKIADKAKRDTYFLCKVVLGYSALVPHTHLALTRFLDTAIYPRRQILMPRTHFKTTIATIAHSIKLVLNDSNLRILIVADTGTNAERFMEEISNHFKHNQMLQWLFPKLIPENFNKATWNRNEIVIPRTANWKEPTFDAIGAMGGIESRHYDVIKPDDLVTEKHIHSRTELDKLLRWSGGLEPLLVPVEVGVKLAYSQMDFVGSRKVKGDLYEQQENYYGGSAPKRQIGPHAYVHGTMAIFSRSIVEEGKRIFPERVSWSYINRMRQRDPERYHAQLANSPKSQGVTSFNISDVRFFTLGPKNEIDCYHGGKSLLHTTAAQLDRIIVYDPAVAEHRRSSKQAILVLGKGNHPFRFVLEAYVGHFPVDTAVDLLFELDKKWQPSFISIERRGFQGSIKYWLEERSERDNLPFLPVLEWPPDGSPKGQWAKPEHIRGLQPLFRHHLLWLQEDQTDLLDEIEFYPNVRWDDGLDAMAQSLDYWPLMTGTEEFDSFKRRESAFLERMGFGAVDEWNEAEFLASFSNTGYSMKKQLN